MQTKDEVILNRATRTNSPVESNVLTTKQDRRRMLAAMLLFSIAIAFVLGAVYQAHGRATTERMATALLMPAGLIWIASLAGILVCLVTRRRILALNYLAVAFVFWLASAPVLSTFLIARLESRFEPVSISEIEQLEAVIVLGGGTALRPDGIPELTAAGDRVAQGAIFYLKSKAIFLVTSGSPISGIGPVENDSSDHTAFLWKQFGIPDSGIIQIEGRNTSEEMRSLAKLVEETQWKRVGLITSAFHMPRAMRLASINQLDLIPIPVDYRATAGTDLRNWIPSASGLDNMTKVLHEYLGMFLGR